MLIRVCVTTVQLFFVLLLCLTRKSSCGNARGTPPLRVASARYAALSNGWGGVPHPVLVVVGGYPIQSWWWGGTLGPPHHPDLAGGTPHHPDLGWGTPHTQTWDGVPPPPSSPGVPAHPPNRPGMGYPPPPHKCGQTENITFPHPSDAGGNNSYHRSTTDPAGRSHRSFSSVLSFCSGSAID